MSTAVADILARIDALTPEEREDLDLRLAARVLDAWEKDLEPTRKRLRDQGLTPEHIDRACDEARRERQQAAR
jgi:hypothetical protein